MVASHAFQGQRWSVHACEADRFNIPHPTSARTPSTLISPPASHIHTSPQIRTHHQTMTTLSPSTTFTYPRHYNFPPFFTRQPQLTTFHAQCRKWSLLIQAYCRFHRLFRLPLDSPLFTNERLNRRLVPEDARAVLDFMRSEGRAEWVRGGEERSVAWVWWRTPEEWAGIIGDWVS